MQAIIRLGASFILLFAVSWPNATAWAQQSSETFKAGVFINPPFVMKEDGRFTGMAVDLWEHISARLGYRYSYVEFDTIHDLVEATASAEIDVAVTNLTITEPRAHRVDFTQPWLDGGNRIMVATDQGSSLGGLIAGLSDAGFLEAYAWIASIIVIATILLTLFDRRFDESFPKRWREGVAESFYTVMSVATSGRPPSRKNLFGWAGRIWQGLWLVCGIAVLAYVTSSVTSVMTTLSLANQVHSLEDLSGETVGVMKGTVQEEFVRDEGLRARSYAGIGGAIDALLRGDIAAIIHDAPVLEYYTHTNPDQPLDVVGLLFEKDKYGFAVPPQSSLRRPLTIQLLGALDSGEVDALRTRYLGEP